MKRKIPLFLIVPFLYLGGVCFGTTYYVKNGGNDNNSGTSDAQAWASLHKASTETSNGDKILLKCGDTWSVTVDRRSSCSVGIGLTFAGSGGSTACAGLTPTQGVTIGAYHGSETEGVSGDRPIIDATARADFGYSKSAPKYGPISIGGYNNDVNGGFIVKDLDLRGPADGPAIQLAHSGNANTVIDCVLSGRGWFEESLIQVTGNNHVVENNIFDQLVRSTSTAYGKSVEFFGGSGHTVEGNIFRGYTLGGALRFSNNGTGATIDGNHFYDPDSRSSGTWCVVIRSCNGGTYVVRNNIFDLTGGGDRAMAFWDDHASTTRKLFNNTIVSDGAGLGTHGSGHTVLVQNNIFYDLDYGLKNPGSGMHLKNNVFYSCYSKYDDSVASESNSYATNPNLLNPTMSNHMAGDAKIQTPSDAIDGGVDDDPDIPAVDHEGATRDTAVDIGAFEYGGQGSNQPPQASFNATPTSGEAPLTVQFTDNSTDPDGTVSSWNWNFGDGGTSTQQNPTHTYDNASTYTATLTVTDNDGAPDSASTTIPVSSGETTSIYLEAESGTLYSPIIIGNDSNPTPSGSGYIFAPAGTGDTTNPSAEAVCNIDIPYAGDYYLWLRMYGPTGDNDAMYIGFNGGFDRVYVTQWTEYEWVRVETSHGSGDFSHSLSAGTNQINIGHGEELARADIILITDHADFSPTDDSTDPIIAITQPTSGDVYSTEEDTVDFGGSASDDVGVTSVTWTNSRGGSGTASGTQSWTVSGISLECGDNNVLTVTAQDAAGNSSTDTLTVDVKPCTPSGFDTQ